MKYLLLILLIGCTARRTTDNNLITIILDGSRSKIINGDGHGFIKTWKWEQIEGKGYKINNPNAMITETQVSRGKYAWELTGTDNLGNVGKDTFYYPKRK